MNQAPTDNRLTLDHNGQLPVEAQVGADANLKLTVDLVSLADPDKLGGDGGHFQTGLRLMADDEELPSTPTYDPVKKRLEFNTEMPHSCNKLQVTLFGEPILTMNHDGQGKFAADPTHANDKLLVDELRILADYEVTPQQIPVSRRLFDHFDPAKHAPITDLHTHSSAQLSAKDMVEMAVNHNLSYPVELLRDKLGITFTETEQQAIQVDGGFGSRFSPCEHEGLKCEQQNEKCDVIPLSALTPEHLKQLEEQLKVPQDKILCFSEFDRYYYRFVNPIVKNPDITKDMILRIARDYKRNGIHYAELSTASMLNLDKQRKASWFKNMIEAVGEAEKETGVKLRFLIGLPRNYSPAQVMMELEKIKYAARHPLIAGVDLLGYEFNRTSDFSSTLGHIAQWASQSEETDLKPEHGWDFKRDFTIRIHAGETGKNNGNVAEAVDIAKRYGVHVRIAHAVNERVDEHLDKQIAELSQMKPPLVSMEFCAPSNIAYNNIQDLKDVPYKRWLKCAKSWFLGSDGAGAIQTTPAQMALAAIAGGVKVEQLAQMRKTEEAFIADEQERYTKKMAAYHARYGEEADKAFLKQFSKHVSEINRISDSYKGAKPTLRAAHEELEAYFKESGEVPDEKLIAKFTHYITDKKEQARLAQMQQNTSIELPAEYKSKMPILVAGASGDSLETVTMGAQLKLKRALHMLVESADPSTTYFVVGRSKREGVTAALDEVVLEYNRNHPNNKFNVLALTTQDTRDIARSISWVVPQKGGLDQVPENLISFMRGQQTAGNPGVSVFIGGNNFTADMIRKCRDNDLHYLLMENASGASMQFAKKVATARHFSDGRSLLTRFAAMIEDKVTGVFRKSVNLKDSTQMEAMEAAAKQQYPTPYPSTIGVPSGLGPRNHGKNRN